MDVVQCRSGRGTGHCYTCATEEPQASTPPGASRLPGGTRGGGAAGSAPRLARTRSALCDECHNEVTRHKLSCATGYRLRVKLDEMKATAKREREVTVAHEDMGSSPIRHP